jgi:hypothetical protein
MISRYLRSNVLGLIAVFLAVGGVGYAAGLKKNSVRSKQIKDGQVKLADVGPDAVDGSRVADGSLTGADLGNGTLTGAQIEESTLDLPAPTLSAEDVPDPVFTSMTPLLINSWEQVGGGNPPEISKDALGIVRMRGDIHDGNSNDDLPFVLPPQFRPDHDVTLHAMTFNGESVLINLTSAGVANVVPEVNCTGCGGVNEHRSLLILDPVSFAAD